MQKRHLTPQEISSLQVNGCTASDWARVWVTAPLDPRRLRRVTFSGTVTLGAFGDILCADDDIPRPSGIYDCVLHDCTIGSHSFLRNVGLMARCTVGHRCIVENTARVAAHGPSSFGNGTRVAVVNEAGGRAIPICDRLTAQSAYLAAMYRHDHTLVQRLEEMVQRRVQQVRSSTMVVADGAWVRDCGILKNLYVGRGARVCGALRLENGTVAGAEQDPVFVGEGVCADGFVALAGARITGGSHVQRCLVGQGVHLEKGVSVQDCLLFANCEFSNGEMVSVFAGPHTVSHHKSTLLIAGIYSFFNAGSATNQSNHMYKLGPVHAGVVERGCKTGSGAYLLWPSRVGAFNVVVGRHALNLDSSEWPFSVIREQEGHSLLLPGVVLLGCGLRRDQHKWQSRDRRTIDPPLDIVHTEVMTPVTMGGALAALDRVAALEAKASSRREYVVWKGMRLKRRMLESARHYYRLALDCYLGEKMAERLEGLAPKGAWADVRRRLAPDSPTGAGRWVDVAGWVVPWSVVAELIGRIDARELTSLDEIIASMRHLERARAEHEWSWCVGLWHGLYGIGPEALEGRHLHAIARRYRQAAAERAAMMELDAAREFAAPATIGAGIDDEGVREQDFAAVRGDPGKQSFLELLEADRCGMEKRVACLERCARMC